MTEGEGVSQLDKYFGKEPYRIASGKALEVQGGQCE